MAPNKKSEIVLLAEQGKFSKAKVLCKKLCKQAPNDPELWFLFGSINGALEDFSAAEFCCKKALKLAPQNPMLIFNLGIALLKQGKASKAIEQFKKSISLQPQNADAYLELANSFSSIGNTSDAILNYKQAIKINPHSAIIFHNMADAYRKSGDITLSIDNYEQAIAIKKDFVEPYCGLSLALIEIFNYDKIIDLLESGITYLPATSALHFYLAVAYQEQGQVHKASSHFTKTLEIEPDYCDAQIGLASMLALQGDYNESGKLLTDLLEKNPENSAAIITYVTYANQFNSVDKAIALGTNFLNKKDITDSTKSKLLFALAKLHEKTGALDTAFNFYREGNELRKSNFDQSKHIKMFDSFVDAYTKELFTDLRTNLQAVTSTTTNPIFIVGMPRSGTSLAEQILASHPDVFGAGELPTINRLIQKLPQKLGTTTMYPECITELTPPLLNKLANEYMEETSSLSNGEKFITDKMPLNAIHLGFISLLFPNARIIHCVRDPLDTCLSCYFTNFSGEHAYAFSLTNLGIFYRMYERQMAHWKKTIPNPIFELPYENIVANPEQVIRELVEFCDLEWNDRCLNFHSTKRTVATASHDQVRKKMYSSSIGKWHNYEHHLSELFAALEDT